MAASEVRRAIMGRIPDSLRNCVNKEYFVSPNANNFAANFGETLSQLNPAAMLVNNGAGVAGVPTSGYPFSSLGVGHLSALDPLHVAAAAAQLGAPVSHSQPHSTLQDINNHMKQESSEVH
jgi:hypothetical protein